MAPLPIGRLRHRGAGSAGRAEPQHKQGSAQGPNAFEVGAYKALADLFNNEETAFWTRNNILVIVQGGLIAALCGILSNADRALGATAPQHTARLFFPSLVLLALIGLATATAWLFMVRRSQRIADTIRHQLGDIEAELASRPDAGLAAPYLVFTNWGRQLSGLDDGPGHWSVVRTRLNSQRLAHIWFRLGAAFVAIWAGLCALFGAAAVTGYGRDAERAGSAQHDAQVHAALLVAAKAAESAASSALASARAAESAASAARAAALQAASASRRESSAAKAKAKAKRARRGR